MKYVVKLSYVLLLLVVAPVVIGDDLDVSQLYGVWSIDKMYFGNGQSLPGDGSKIEFTKNNKMRTIMGKSVIENEIRIDGSSFYVKTRIGEAEHKITSLSFSHMELELPGGIKYIMSKSP